MNKGIRLATGDIVGFLNADDFYASPDALKKVAAAFNDPTVDACYGDLLYVRKSNPSAIVRYWRSCPFVKGLFDRGWSPPHPTFFVRRKVYEQYGGFNLEYRIAADMEIMFRILEVKAVKSLYIPEIIIKMRTGGESNQSLRNIIRQNREIVRVLNAASARKISVAKFLARKSVSKAAQFLTRPTET